MISGFRRDIDENCALLEYYAASSVNPLPTFRHIEDWTNRLSRNVGKGLLLGAA
jgi:hypothetical protein